MLMLVVMVMLGVIVARAGRAIVKSSHRGLQRSLVIKSVRCRH
jgi:hypothetical protein